MLTVLLQISAPSGCERVVVVPVLGKYLGVGCVGCVVMVVVPVLRKPGLGCVVVVAVPVLGKCHGVGCVVMVVVPVLRNPGLGCGCPCDWWISGCVCVSWMDDAGGGRIGEILGCVGMKRWVGVAGGDEVRDFEVGKMLRPTTYDLIRTVLTIHDTIATLAMSNALTCLSTSP